MRESSVKKATITGAVLLGIGAWFGLVGALHVYVPFVKPWMAFNLTGMGQAAVAAPAALIGAVLVFLANDPDRDSRIGHALLVAGAILMLVGAAVGLLLAPAEQFMGQTQRIMYVHVPTAWTWMLAVLFAFASAIMFLFRGDFKWDARLEAGLEVSTLFAFLLCVQGSIWAKPTWGVWWDWDPRLTSVAVLLFATLGIIALRNFVDNAERRAIWSSVATIIASVDLPIVYYSVKWWNSLHQAQSNPNTVSPAFHLPLRLNAFGILFLMMGFIILRARIASMRLQEERSEPPEIIHAEEAGELV